MLCGGCGHGIRSHWDQRICQKMLKDARTCTDML